MSDFEARVLQILQENKDETHRLSQQIQENVNETRKLSQQMVTFENNMVKKLDLVAEGYQDHDRQIQGMRADLNAVKTTLAEAVVVKVMQKAE